MRSHLPRVLLGLVAVFAVHYACVKPTNFDYYDGWFILSLVSRGLVSHPYAGRSLALVWELPAAWIAPFRLDAYLALHALYLLMTGMLVYWISRRVEPAQPVLAFVAGVVCLVWAPADPASINPCMGYGGITFGCFLAVALLLESWVRRSRGLLAVASLTAILTLRSYEAVVVLLSAAPLLLVFTARRAPRPWAWAWAWAGCWYGAVAIGASHLLLGTSGDGAHYRNAVGLDLQPLHIIERLAELYRLHLAPLVSWPGMGPAPFQALAAAAVFVGVFVLVGDPEGVNGLARKRRLLATALGGLFFAGLGYLPYTVSPNLLAPGRTQMLSRPGIAVFLVAAAALVAGLLPRRLQRISLAILASWVVFAGTIHLAILQGQADVLGGWAVQSRLLRQLTKLAPRLEPHTLVVLLDDDRAFPATFTFRHAVELLYPGEAIGMVWNGVHIYYPARLTPEGIRCEPGQAIRQAWRSPPSLHTFAELLVVRHTVAHQLVLEESWPPGLPALPEGASYRPRARIREGAEPPSRTLLDPPLWRGLWPAGRF